MATAAGASGQDLDIYGITTDTLRFVMVGMTGTGKSALGNSILAWGFLKAGQVWSAITKPFRSKASPNSVTVNCKTERATVLGQKIMIVDTPGFIDTAKGQDETLEELVKCVLEVAPGPHAILLVVKLDRFTKDVVNGIDMMKKVFGQESVKHLIVVFTYIDILEDETLENYIDEMDPTGGPRKLLKECNMRYVGFNNKFAPMSNENSLQVTKLFSMAEALTKANGGHCYTQEILQKAKEAMANKTDVATASQSPAGQEIKEDIKKKSGGCFASTSVVRVRDSQGNLTVKSLKDLVVGDLVQSYDAETNSLTYSPVYYIIYQDDDDRMSSMRELYYEGSDGKEYSIRLQGKHLIYASCGPLPALKTELPPSTPVMSEKVKVGDILWVADDDTGELYPRRVLKISEIVANVRHPMTMNHTIVVDGVLASVHMHNEWLLRQATAPLCLLYKISPRLSDFWISKKAVQAWDYVELYLLE